jgi:hypothetical protein
MLILFENSPLRGHNCAKKKIKWKIKRVCTTRLGDKHSCEVSLKSPIGFGDEARTTLFYSKIAVKGP